MDTLWSDAQVVDFDSSARRTEMADAVLAALDY